MPWRHEHAVLRDIEAGALDGGQGVHAQRRDLHAARREPEFLGRLDGIDGVVAPVVHGDHIGLRGLRLQHEGGEIGGTQRRLHRTDDLRARRLHGAGDGGLQRGAEGVVRRNEEPLLAERRHGEADALAHLVGVIDPVHGMVGRAGLAGEIGGPGAGQQHRLVLRLRNIQHGEPDGGVHEVSHRIDLVDVKPTIGDGDAHVRLVLMVARENFDGGAIDLAAHLLRRHARRLDGAITGVLLVSA